MGRALDDGEERGGVSVKMRLEDLTPLEREDAARGCRAVAYRIRLDAERHIGTSSYEQQIEEAERFERLAEKFAGKKRG
jgi:hypothetical protein